jgi:hypothetical protein
MPLDEFEDLILISVIIRTLTIFGAVALLAACSTTPKGIRISSDGSSATTDKTPEQIRNFSAEEVRTAVVGKTFQYTRPDGNGYITFNGDGSFSYQDDSKGGGEGKWTADGTQYCETFGRGPTECGDFKYTGDAYFASKSRLVEMKVQ